MQNQPIALQFGFIIYHYIKEFTIKKKIGSFATKIAKPEHACLTFTHRCAQTYVHNRIAPRKMKYFSMNVAREKKKQASNEKEETARESEQRQQDGNGNKIPCNVRATLEMRKQNWKNIIRTKVCVVSLPVYMLEFLCVFAEMLDTKCLNFSIQNFSAFFPFDVTLFCYFSVLIITIIIIRIPRNWFDCVLCVYFFFSLPMLFRAVHHVSFMN